MWKFSIFSLHIIFVSMWMFEFHMREIFFQYFAENSHFHACIFHDLDIWPKVMKYRSGHFRVSA